MLFPAGGCWWGKGVSLPDHGGRAMIFNRKDIRIRIEFSYLTKKNRFN